MVQKISHNADGELRFEDDVETTELKLAQLKANFGKNLILNPQFDSYNIDTNLPDFWTLLSTPTLDIAADTLFPGRQGNQITITASGGSPKGIQLVGAPTNWLKVLPETKYMFSIDDKVTAGDMLIISIASYAGAVFKEVNLETDLNSVTRVRDAFSFTTHADADNLSIRLLAKNIGDIVFVSHPKLEQGSIATPFVEPDRDRMTVRTEITNSTPDPVIASRWNKHNITAQGDGPTISAPTGLVYDGDKLRFRFEDDGTGRAITWNAIYEAVQPLPATTTAGKKLYIDFDYNAADVKFDCVYSVEEP